LVLLLAPVAVVSTLAAGRPGWNEIGPVFEARCVNCHGPLGAGKGLRLDSYEGAMAGSTDGPVLIAGDPDGSELVKRIRGQSVPRMPFLGPPLPPEELDLIVRWTEAGMPETTK
jgi:mono/diheme cytochrome c family protein